MSFGRLHSRPPARPMSEINMTPLIDVMLVLLVIFMVAAPLLASRLVLDLPQTEAVDTGSEVPPPAVLALALDAEGRLFIAEQSATEAELLQQVQAAAARQPDTEVLLRADARVPYGRVAALIAQVQAGGLWRIGLANQAPAAESGPAAPR